MKQQALGLIETKGLVAAIEAADVALKAAAVELLNYEKVTGGLVTVALTGEVAAVQAAVAAGSTAAARLGQLIGQHVIPRPLADLDLLIRQRGTGSTPEPLDPKDLNGTCSEPAESDKVEDKEIQETAENSSYHDYLNSLSVHELRRLARTIDNIAIKGRQISKANKDKLIQEILKAKFDHR